MTEQSLLEIMSTRLTFLDLSNQQQISAQMLGQLGYLSPQLQTLNLAQTCVTDKVLIELAKSCEHLTDINLARCLRLTDVGFSTFIQLKPNLISLNIENNNNDYIQDATLQHLKHCVHLEQLNINQCERLTDAFFDIVEPLKKIKAFFASSNNFFQKNSKIYILFKFFF